MDRDFESKKHGYSAESYLEVLNAEVAPIFEDLEPGYEYMQDNASIHTAQKVKDWFKDRGILLVINWPPYSPDLNPIEHIWWALKTRMCEMFPDVAADKSESDWSRQRLESCLQAAWETLDKELFDVLYKVCLVESRLASQRMGGIQNIEVYIWSIGEISRLF
jgi:hypothetical protein